MKASFKTYLRNRPSLLKLGFGLRAFGRLSTKREQRLGYMFKVQASEDLLNPPEVYLSAPKKIDPYKELPNLNSSCLGRCMWQIDLRYQGFEAAENFALEIGKWIVNVFDGGLYDCNQNELIYPERAQLLTLADTTNWPAWDELHSAFNFDGSILQIKTPVSTREEWLLILSEVIKLGFVVQRFGSESTASKINEENLKTFDFSASPSGFQMQRKGVFLTCFINESQLALFNLNASEIVAYCDAIVVLELMQALATRLRRTVFLVPFGSTDNIISIQKCGALSFEIENCPIDFFD